MSFLSFLFSFFFFLCVYVTRWLCVLDSSVRAYRPKITECLSNVAIDWTNLSLRIFTIYDSCVYSFPRNSLRKRARERLCEIINTWSIVWNVTRLTMSLLSVAKTERCLEFFFFFFFLANFIFTDWWMRAIVLLARQSRVLLRSGASEIRLYRWRSMRVIVWQSDN